MAQSLASVQPPDPPNNATSHTEGCGSSSPGRPPSRGGHCQATREAEQRPARHVTTVTAERGARHRHVHELPSTTLLSGITTHGISEVGGFPILGPSGFPIP